MATKLQLTYSPNVRESDLLGRVMGPDGWDALYYVVAVFELSDCTKANLWPLPKDETRIRRDDFMQEWVTF